MMSVTPISYESPNLLLVQDYYEIPVSQGATCA